MGKYLKYQPKEKYLQTGINTKINTQNDWSKTAIYGLTISEMCGWRQKRNV
jgi:hypothetical protein